MKRKIKYLSDCELRVLFLFWSVEAPAARAVVENELEQLGWDSQTIGGCLDSLVQKSLISRHWLGHGSSQKEFYMPHVSERDYWKNTGCTQRETPKCATPAPHKPFAFSWI